MNRRVVALVSTAALYAAACSFNIRINESATTTVPEGSLVEDLVGDLGFGEFANMDLTDAQELRNQGVEPGDIDNVQLIFFELEAVSPEGADLSFIESMDIYVEAPGLERELLATASEFPAGEPLVAFEVPELDLTDYVVSESMDFVTEVSGRRPNDETEVEARFAVRVGVTGQGACNEISGD